jgi:hypothetical protein
MYILSCYSPWDSELAFYKNVTQVMKIQDMYVQKSSNTVLINFTKKEEKRLSSEYRSSGKVQWE